MVTQQESPQTFEELAAWAGSWPFLGQPVYPRVIHEHEAKFQAWGISSEGLNRTPVWFYASTDAINTGIFSLAPGDYFKPGNHPNPEPYLILDGTIHLGNPDTGQLQELSKGDVVVIPAMQMHVGYNFGFETCRMLWMIPHQIMTDEFIANPVYDDHYMNIREPIVLHKTPVHEHHQHAGFAQPDFNANEAPQSRHVDLKRWPPASGESVARDSDVDNAQLYHRAQWLHFVTGADFAHQFLTSLAYATDAFQMGTIRIPSNRITNAIQVNAERVYYPLDESGQLIVNLMETNASIIGSKGDALFVPAGVEHQFQNPGAQVVEAAFVCAAAPGNSVYGSGGIES